MYLIDFAKKKKKKNSRNDFNGENNAASYF